MANEAYYHINICNINININTSINVNIDININTRMLMLMANEACKAKENETRLDGQYILVALAKQALKAFIINNDLEDNNILQSSEALAHH